MKTKSAALGVAAVLLAGGAALVTVATANANNAPATSTPTAACVHEDSPGPCYWDARTMGNHKGRSFYVDAAQVVHYKD